MIALSIWDCPYTDWNESYVDEHIFHSPRNILNISTCLYIWLHFPTTANIVVWKVVTDQFCSSGVSHWLEVFALAVITSRQQNVSPAASCPRRLLKPRFTKAICKWQQTDEEIDNTAPKQWWDEVHDHRWIKSTITGINVMWVSLCGLEFKLKKNLSIKL